MLLQLLEKQVLTISFLQLDVTDQVLKILLLHLYLLFIKNLKKMLQRAVSQLVSQMMLQTYLYQKLNQLLLHLLLVQQSVTSGGMVEPVLQVLTRTLQRSSVTTQINTFRHTSSMTPRRQVVLQFLTFVLVTIQSEAHTTLIRLTSQHVTTHLMQLKVTRWFRMLNQAESS